MADPKSLNPKKVRLIGKIKGRTVHESATPAQPWITYKNPEGEGSSDKSLVFFDAQSSSRKDVFELDYCYGQDEEIDLIYSREINPLISEAFAGRNASIIALGARGSGKTYTIQGSKERPGLAVMAMSEILSRARELGKLVSVSLYELTQDHAYDLLDPNHPEVQVLEDGRGKMNFKGLSQVHVKSVAEFNEIYSSDGKFHKAQKIPLNQPRNHRGLMVHIEDNELETKLTNKINFVDLAGYEDPKRSRRDGVTPVESNRINKSLYAMLNVISALSSNEIHVPYRASKFTRVLQDSLQGTSRILLLTCLNASFCEDTISSISLVTRSCRSTRQVLTDSTNRSQSSVKGLSSVKGGKPVSASLSVKRQVGRSKLLSEQKVGSTVKGRKLFDEGKGINQGQLKCQSENTSVHKSKSLQALASKVPPFSLDEVPPDENILEVSPTLEPRNVPSSPISQDTWALAVPNEKPAILDEKNVSPHGTIKHPEATPHLNSDVKPHNHDAVDVTTYEVNNILYKKSDTSPPLSEKIKEISDSLKALYSSTPLRIALPEVAAPPCSSQVGHNDVMHPKNSVTEPGSATSPPQVGHNDVMHPKTPVTERGSARHYSPPQVGHNDDMLPKTPTTELGSARHYSPPSTFSNRISGAKHAIVQEYLKFLNSSSKEELKALKGIGEKRATYILELREESPEPFKTLDDLQDIGMSAKQIKGMMRQVAGQLLMDK